MTFELIRCDQAGALIEGSVTLSDELVASCAATADLYRRVGYVPPWVGYVSVVECRGVGGGAFVGPPQEGCVEIAYFTLEDEKGKGFASRTAASLVEIARTYDSKVQLKAFTLMEDNASTRILKRLGFKVVGTAEDVDAGQVWEWRA